MRDSVNGKMLVDIGLGEDLDFCMDVDRFNGVPLYCDVMDAFSFCAAQDDAPEAQDDLQTGYPRPQIDVIRSSR